MLKKRFSILVSTVLLAFAGLSFSGCAGGPSISGISMANSEVLNIPFGNFSYDGIKVDVNYTNGQKTTIDLTEDMIPVNEQVKFYKIGEQDIQVSFRDKYFTTMKVNVVLNQFKDIYKLEDLTVTYDGLPHSLTINEELPEGSVIEYPYGNTFTNAGKYEVMAVISKSGYESKTLSATLTINQNQRDSESIVFNDTTFVYNGEMKSVQATNVPEGVTVDYAISDYETDIKINKIVNVGKYKVVAKFTDVNNNYKKIDDKIAIVSVVKGEYDMSSYLFNDVTKTYDGKKYNAHINNEDSLPAGVTVSYSYYNSLNQLVTDNKECGTYKMVATFSGGDSYNYNPIKPKEATLLVEPIQVNLVDKVFFIGATWNYGETPEDLQVLFSDDFPLSENEYGVKFYKEDGTEYQSGDFVYAGQYPVVCDFYSKDSNKSFIVDDLTSYVNILPVEKAVNITSLTVSNGVPIIETDTDGVVLNVISDGVTTSPDISFYDASTDEPVEIANLVNGKHYRYRASLVFSDENLNRSMTIPDVSGEYTHSI